MLDFLTYDFGYSWSVRYAMLVPLILAGGVAAFAVWRSWSRWVIVPMALVVVWAAAAVVFLNGMLNRPMPLPTERFLTSGSGRVLDVGAGSGRAAIGVLLARPHTTATGVDIYSGYWGIDENTPERFMRNARIAGVGERAAARAGDMRELQFGDGEFDAVVSSYAIDHLRRDERPKAIAEVARVLKPGGEFLLMIIQVNWKTWLVSPLLAHHPSQNSEPWRALLQENGFRLEEEGTQFTTLYFLAKKAQKSFGSSRIEPQVSRLAVGVRGKGLAVPADRSRYRLSSAPAAQSWPQARRGPPSRRTRPERPGGQQRQQPSATWAPTAAVARSPARAAARSRRPCRDIPAARGAGPRVRGRIWVMSWQDRISVNPAVRSGKPCIKGTRITVYDVLEYLAGGMTEDQILSDFPDLSREDIRAALAFAAARERRVANSVA